MNKFRELGLSQDVVKVLDSLDICEPTEIQEKAIPILLEGYDLKGGSATGSGKTLAFASPIIEKLRPNGRVQALILTPTRELAEQVAESIRKFSRERELNILAVYGGVSIDEQVRRLAVTDIVVGTPGRILDHLERKTLRLDSVKFLVLDEVDRMFDMGFRFDVEKIVRHCPRERQTMMFSATLTEDVNYLASKYSRDPKEVSVNSYIDPSQLKQIYYDVDNGLKFSLLVYLLKNEKAGLVMVFCSTRRNVDFIEKNLNKNGIEAKAIHGGLSQNQRNRVLSKFHDNQVSVMVCTDVAARGLDIKGVSHVYNYDLPASSEDYTHRIGRTARAGEDGIAISLLSNRDYENFDRILRDDKINIHLEALPDFKKIEMKSTMDRRPSRGRGFGGRESGQRGGGRGGQGRDSRDGKDRGDRRGSRDNQGGRRDSRPRNNNRLGDRNNSRPRDGPRDGGRKNFHGGNRGVGSRGSRNSQDGVVGGRRGGSRDSRGGHGGQRDTNRRRDSRRGNSFSGQRRQF